MVSVFQTGKQEAQRGRGLTQGQTAQRPAGRQGWVDIRTFPTMGSSTEPQVSAPQCTRPDKKSAMRAPATVDKRRVRWGWGTPSGAALPTLHPTVGSPSFMHSPACSLTCYGGGVPSLLPCEWSLRYNTPVALLALPRGYVGTHLLGGSGGNKPGMSRSTQLFPSRS